MSFQQYNVSPWLTPVRLVATSNQSGTYVNGALNNGVGATFTYATGALSIDSVVVNVGDRILFEAQTAANQNGIYVCNVAGATGVAAVLQRSADLQCIEQLYIGQYVTVGAGTADGGAAFVLVEPKPAQFGISNMVWSASPLNSGLGTAAAKAASNNSLATVASVNTPTIVNHLATYADTNGTLSEDAATAINGGNIQAGLSGTAGTVGSFPATAANGELLLAAVNAGGAFNTTISNGTMGQSTVYTMGDIGASTGGLVVATAAVRLKSVAGAVAAGGAAAQSFTDAFCTSGSNVVGNWNTQANAVSVLKIVPGNGSFVVTSSGDAGAGTFNYVIMK